MRLRVENLGPLREAEVDLGKRLIVFTGPNNTGKTYLATAVYGFAQTRPEPPKGIFDLIRPVAHTGRFSVDEGALTLAIAARLKQRATSLVSDLDECFGTRDGTFEDCCVTTSTTSDAARQAIVELPRSSSGYKAGSGIGYLRRTLVDPFVIEFAVVDEATARRWKPSADPVSDDVWSRVPTVVHEKPPDELRRRARTAVAVLVDQLTARRSRIFPAERLAISLFAREIAAARTQLVDELLGAEPKELQAQRLPWPIRDAVQSALRLPDDARRTTTFVDLAEDLEREVLGGSVGVSQYGAATFTPHQAPRALDVQQSASVVKSLSSIVFYFRHQAQRGDFLLIDEPELNLHPDNQRKVARFLARAVHRGFRILISTHSDYVLRELSHLLMLGRGDKRARRLVKELDYPEDALLTPQDVGVYLFQEGTAKELPVSEDGFEVNTIEDEIARLNETSQKIYTTFME